MFQYAAARALASSLNVGLALDRSYFRGTSFRDFGLQYFTTGTTYSVPISHELLRLTGKIALRSGVSGLPSYAPIMWSRNIASMSCFSNFRRQSYWMGIFKVTNTLKV